MRQELEKALSENEKLRSEVAKGESAKAEMEEALQEIKEDLGDLVRPIGVSRGPIIFVEAHSHRMKPKVMPRHVTCLGRVTHHALHICFSGVSKARRGGRC